MSFFSANVTKVEHGAWLPLLVGVVVANVMLTWRKGRDLLTRNRTEEEGSLQEFLEGLCSADPPIVRLPGTAIFLNPNKQTTPLAMRAQVEHLHAFQDTVVMVALDPIPIPHVDKEDRFAAERLGKGMFKIIYLTIRTGYRDRTNLPLALDAGPQTRDAAAQPRPRARLLLRQPDVDRADRRGRDAAAGASACSSRWRATRRARSSISGCRGTGP